VTVLRFLVMGGTVLGEDLRLLDCVAVDERWREGGGNIEEGSR